MDNKFTTTFNYKLIYIFRINDEAHKGLLKIGDATLHTNTPLQELLPSCRDLNKAAKDRINQYTGTAGITYELLHTEIIITTDEDGKIKATRDYKVHTILRRSGIKHYYFDTEHKQNEWFQTDLETAKKALLAIKEGRKSLYQKEITTEKDPIIFRPEQKAAIEKTIAQFKKSHRMLWNAKMRFGKTLSALEVAKRMNFKRIIIFTHRPIVSDSWFDDFGKIFYDTDLYIFGSKNKDKGILLEDLEKSGKNYVYFASIQDLRGSSFVGGNFDKNDEVFNMEWDLVIIDEAHEGTQTDQGRNVIEAVKKEHTKILELSGTPFNLLSDYEEKEIYTWDYVMEQKAKNDWETNHFCDTNPYEELPTLNIYTYALGKLFANSAYQDLEDKAFNFKEFFRTWTGDLKADRKHLSEHSIIGEFVHKDDVQSFLNLITKVDSNNHYPYSTVEYQEFFRHSLWMVPGVKEAKALSTLMKNHPVFGSAVFHIVNVAGDGDEEQNSSDALLAVRKAIKETEHTITLSCGRLTTGVSVPEWTAVFMLAGTYSTSASNYLQTIFRVQTPANIGGKIKEKCYVFDFAPDRTLKIIAEASKISANAGKTSNNDRQIMGEFLNYCPVISIDGSKMQPYNVDSMLQQLKRAYTDKVVRNGFDDSHIYNDELLKLDGLALDDFKQLKEIIGASKQTKKSGEINVNDQGFTNEEYEQLERLYKKPKKELSLEELKYLDEVKNKRKNRETAISILRGISIRIPLLVYGANTPFDQEITVENFAKLIDPLSWEEFMPKGVTKDLFKKFTKYYDPDIFVAAGRQIRNLAKSADEHTPTERVKKIAALFATFKNPDKETVLTPWRVVNMHMSDCLGGYNFFDITHENILEEPRFVEYEKVTADTLANSDARVLEINSKTGLYPLYVAYSIFRNRCDAFSPTELDDTLENRLWEETVSENVYIICKTPMAMSITKRTLVGYSDAKVNTHHFEDLVNQITNKAENFLKKVPDGKSYWKSNNDTNMKFNAIVGNPPYQVMDGGGAGSSAIPVYNKFVEIAKKLQPDYLSMIIPSKWYSGGKGLDQFRESMLNDQRMNKLIDFDDSRECFQGVDIAGGICYFLWMNEHFGLCQVTNHKKDKKIYTQRLLNEFGTFIRNADSINIINKVKAANEKSLSTEVYSRKPFGLGSNAKGCISPFEGSITLYGSQGISYIKADDVSINRTLISKWKVIMSKTSSEHAGQSDKDGKKKVISRIEVLAPNVICTESYLLLSVFNNELEAINLTNYVKTQFFRYLLSTILLTQNIAKDKFQFIPVQDFTKSWSDEELYAKYGLTDEEIAFIDSTIKPMK